MKKLYVLLASILFIAVFSVFSTSIVHSQTANSANSVSNSVLPTTVIFSENGLPANALWHIAYNGTGISATAPSNIILSNISINYTFSVAQSRVNNITFYPSSPTGTFGPGQNVIINYSVVTTFIETGLPANS